MTCAGSGAGQGGARQVWVGKVEQSKVRRGKVEQSKVGQCKVEERGKVEEGRKVD